MFKFLAQLFDKGPLLSGPTPTPPNVLKPHGEPLSVPFLVSSSSGIGFHDLPSFSNRPYADLKMYMDEIKELKANYNELRDDWNKILQDNTFLEYKLRIARAMNNKYVDELDKLKVKRLAAIEKKLPSGYKVVKV